MSLKRSTELQTNNKRAIDKEVYLDAQSKGFASRIVKYHQDASPSRQLSQYKSPGDLPIVHLKRNDILFKNRRSNSLSNLRIGRLDKYYTSSGTAEGDSNTRRPSALQRGLTSYDDTYRPIPVRPSAAATSSSCDVFSGPRSVLDELKEISRKRINNKYDEEIHVNETKKYCRESAEVTDGPSGVPVVLMTANNYHHHQQQQKRQRENNISPPLSPGVAQQRSKKLCRDSYDVISSLSSSIGLARSKSTIPSAPVPPANKRPAVDLRPSKTGLPPTKSTALSQPVAVFNNRQQDTPLRATASVPVLTLTKEEPKLTLFNKDYKTIPAQKRKVAHSDDDDEYDDEESAGRNPFVKPQDNSPTLATGLEEKRKVEKNKLALMLKCLAGDFEDSDEEEDTNKDVVDKPVKSSFELNIPVSTTAAVSTAPTPVTAPIEKTTNQVVVETTTKATPEPQPLIAQPTAEDNVVKTSNIAPSIPALGIPERKPATIVSATPPADMFNFSSNKTTAITSTATSESIAVVSAPQSALGFKFPTSTTVTSIPAITSLPTPAAATPTAFPAPVSSIETTKSSIPGIFSFSKSPPQTAQQPTPAIPAFGAAAPISTQPSKIPVATFSFGSSNAAPTAVPISAAAPAPVAVVNTSMFSFGSTPSKDPTPSLLPATSAPVKAPFAFGNNSNGTSTAPSTAPVPSLFSFESGTSNTTAAPVSKSTTFSAFSTGPAVVPSTTSAFGGMGSGSVTTAAAPSTAPVFGGSAATPSFSFDNKKTTPVFGSNSSSSIAAQPAPAVAPSSTFSFGGSSSSMGLGTTSTTSANPFGNNTTTPIFGSAATQPAPPAYGAPKTVTSPFGGPTTSNAPTFGGSQQRPSATAAPFGFGGSAQPTIATNQNAEPQKSSTFAFGTGTAAAGGTTNSSPFAFGGGSNPQPAPIFGSSSSNAAAAPAFGGPPRSATASPFGDNKANSTFSFGQQAAAAPQPSVSSFNFSGSNGGGQGPAASTGGSFKFGEPSAQTTQTNAPSMFNFGGAPQPTASNSFAFGQSNGGGLSNQVAGNGGGMFNFGAQGDANAGAPAGPTFNIGSGGGGPPRRPIRQATRRMK